MATDLELARACADSYDSGAAWDDAWEFSGTRLTHRRIGGESVLVFRGSCTAEDWIRDAEAFPVWDSRIGFVHGGFMVGMGEALATAAGRFDGPVIVTGHSLGGARARILAALLACAGRPVARCAVFGSPRPGFANLARILQKTATPLASYRNRNDPVPLVPFMGGLYQHPDEWARVDSAPGSVDLDPLRDHSVALYVSALAALAPAAAGGQPQAKP